MQVLWWQGTASFFQDTEQQCLGQLHKSCDYALILADSSMIVLAPGEDMIPHSNPASRSHRRKLEAPQWISRFFRHQALYPLTLLIPIPTADALFHLSSSIVSAGTPISHGKLRAQKEMTWCSHQEPRHLLYLGKL